MSDEQFSVLITDQLLAVEDRLIEAATSDNPFVNEAAGHVMSAGGKRFRPALVSIAAHLAEAPDPERLIKAALVVELSHVASLYHDDVMDDADIRRGVASANRQYGNTVAILVGDFLFARASSQVASLGKDFVLLQADTFAELVTGQIAETVGPDPDEDPIAHHLRVLSGKTASLIRTSVLFGGMVADAGPQILDALGRYGHEIGMVFQLSDDLIDVISDTTGKTPGTDLREGVPTLPTLLLRASSDPADQELVSLIDAGLADDDDLARALAGLRASDVIVQVRAEINRRAEIARGHLAPLPDGAPKRALAKLCDEVVTRSS
ncbi:MAG: polyprenyl synthetase family protein [Brooklawnia sp.]|jgi:heptaprenyl diphosphate synthase